MSEQSAQQQHARSCKPVLIARGASSRRVHRAFKVAFHLILCAILGVCVATWIRSYSYAQLWQWIRVRGDQRLVTTYASSRGTVQVEYRRSPTTRAGYSSRFLWWSPLPYQIHGATGYYESKIGVDTVSTLRVPWYLPTCVLGFLQVAAGTLFLVRRRRKLGAHHCANCGYDLRSGHDVCPECGSPVVTAAA